MTTMNRPGHPLHPATVSQRPPEGSPGSINPRPPASAADPDDDQPEVTIRRRDTEGGEDSKEQDEITLKGQPGSKSTVAPNNSARSLPPPPPRGAPAGTWDHYLRILPPGAEDQRKGARSQVQEALANMDRGQRVQQGRKYTHDEEERKFLEYTGYLPTLDEEVDARIMAQERSRRAAVAASRQARAAYQKAGAEYRKSFFEYTGQQSTRSRARDAEIWQAETDRRKTVYATEFKDYTGQEPTFAPEQDSLTWRAETDRRMALPTVAEIDVPADTAKSLMTAETPSVDGPGKFTVTGTPESEGSAGSKSQGSLVEQGLASSPYSEIELYRMDFKDYTGEDSTGDAQQDTLIWQRATDGKVGEAIKSFPPQFQEDYHSRVMDGASSTDAYDAVLQTYNTWASDQSDAADKEFTQAVNSLPQDLQSDYFERVGSGADKFEAYNTVAGIAITRFEDQKTAADRQLTDAVNTLPQGLQGEYFQRVMDGADPFDAYKTVARIANTRIEYQNAAADKQLTDAVNALPQGLQDEYFQRVMDGADPFDAYKTVARIANTRIEDQNAAADKQLTDAVNTLPQGLQDEYFQRVMDGSDPFDAYKTVARIANTRIEDQKAAADKQLTDAVNTLPQGLQDEYFQRVVDGADPFDAYKTVARIANTRIEDREKAAPRRFGPLDGATAQPVPVGQSVPMPADIEGWKARGTVYINNEPVQVQDVIETFFGFKNLDETPDLASATALAEQRALQYLEQGYLTGGVRMVKYGPPPRTLTLDDVRGGFSIGGQEYKFEDYFEHRPFERGQYMSREAWQRSRDRAWDRQLRDLQTEYDAGRLHLGEDTPVPYYRMPDGGYTIGDLAGDVIGPLGLAQAAYESTSPHSPSGTIRTSGESRHIAVEGAFAALDVLPIPVGKMAKGLRGGAGVLVDAGGNLIRTVDADHKIQRLHAAVSHDPRALEFVEELKASGVPTLRAYEISASSKGLLPADYGALQPAPSYPPVPGYGEHGRFGGRVPEMPGLRTAPVVRDAQGRIVPIDELQRSRRHGGAGPHQEVREIQPGFLTEIYGPTHTTPTVSPDMHVVQISTPGSLGPAHLSGNPLATPTYEVPPRVFRDSVGTIKPTAPRIRQLHEPPLGDDARPDILPDSYTLRMEEKLRPKMDGPGGPGRPGDFGSPHVASPPAVDAPVSSASGGSGPVATLERTSADVASLPALQLSAEGTASGTARSTKGAVDYSFLDPPYGAPDYLGVSPASPQIIARGHGRLAVTRPAPSLRYRGRTATPGTRPSAAGQPTTAGVAETSLVQTPSGLYVPAAAVSPALAVAWRQRTADAADTTENTDLEQAFRTGTDTGERVVTDPATSTRYATDLSKVPDAVGANAVAPNLLTSPAESAAARPEFREFRSPEELKTPDLQRMRAASPLEVVVPKTVEITDPAAGIREDLDTGVKTQVQEGVNTRLQPDLATRQLTDLATFQEARLELPERPPRFDIRGDIADGRQRGPGGRLVPRPNLPELGGLQRPAAPITQGPHPQEAEFFSLELNRVNLATGEVEEIPVNDLHEETLRVTRRGRTPTEGQSADTGAVEVKNRGGKVHVAGAVQPKPGVMAKPRPVNSGFPRSGGRRRRRRDEDADYNGPAEVKLTLT